MRAEVMEFYGLTRSPRAVGYYETTHHRQLLQDIKQAVYDGDLVALCGVGGAGKTVTLRRQQELLASENRVIVSKSISVQKSRVTLGTLITALFCDLSTDISRGCGSSRCSTPWPSARRGKWRTTSRSSRRTSSPRRLSSNSWHRLASRDPARGLRQAALERPASASRRGRFAAEWVTGSGAGERMALSGNHLRPRRPWARHSQGCGCGLAAYLPFPAIRAAA